MADVKDQATYPRAVAYLIHDGREGQQRAAIERGATQLRFNVVAEIKVDPNQIDSHSFVRLLEQINENEVSVVLVEDANRISRDMAVALAHRGARVMTAAGDVIA
jgi:DNA invertase Pin-like site-specific DNA recombinase